MTVQKIMTDITPLEEIEKINEIIDNLGSGGESFVDSGYITNSIIEIPQDIKVELNNGALTLKAGSKVYYPDEFESDGTTKKFGNIVIQNDITLSEQPTVDSTDLFIWISQDGNTFSWRDINYIESGNVEPATGSGITYYNVDNNTLIAHDSSTSVDDYVCFPVCSVTCVNGTGITKINHVFNGFSFVGSVLFALPGVTGLLPNGRNKNGTLDNIKYMIDSVNMREFSWNISDSGQYLALFSSGEIIGSSATNRPFYQQEETPPVATNSYWYKPSENVTYATFESETSWIKVPFVIIGKIIGDATGKISSLTTKTAVKLIDENELHNAEAVVETYGNGSNWYRIWSDGWCEQGGISTGAADIQLLKQFSNTDYGVVVTRRDQSENIPFIRNITVSGFTIGWKVEGQPLDVNFVNCTWKAFGYIS